MLTESIKLGKIAEYYDPLSSHKTMPEKKGSTEK